MADDDAPDAGPMAEVVRELYSLPPGEFTQARNERAKAAKAAGDKELAAAIGALRRPSSVAWLINQMVRHHAAELDRLLALGAALRDAQADLDPDQLKHLGRQRHQVVNAFARQARALSRELGNPVADAVESEVEETLRAALADPAAAEAVRSGRLVKGLDYAGIGGGEVDLTGAVAAGPPAPGDGTASPARTPDQPAAARRPRDDEAAKAREQAREQAREEARRAELARARQDVEDGERAVAAADQVLAEADAHVQDVAARRQAAAERIAELERRLAAEREDAAGAAREAQRAASERDRAGRQAELARKAAAQAAARLARLGG